MRLQGRPPNSGLNEMQVDLHLVTLYANSIRQDRNGLCVRMWAGISTDVLINLRAEFMAIEELNKRISRLVHHENLEEDKEKST